MIEKKLGSVNHKIPHWPVLIYRIEKIKQAYVTYQPNFHLS